MKFDTLKSFNKTKLIISGTIISCLILVITIFVSHSKYVYKDNITIMDGTINYTPYDFKIMGIYQQIDSCVGYNCYEEKDIMPSEGYTINEDKTYCYVDDEKEQIKNKVYTNEDGEVVIKELPKRSKCYLYFNKKVTSKDTLDQLAKLTSGLTNQGVIDTNGFTTVETSSSTGKVYETKDNDGTSYFYRGDVQDNYVKFGKTGTDSNSGIDIWWRIIRINGDGSIRMIYAGTGSEVPDQRSDATNIIVNEETKFKFNNAARAEYVGYQYTLDERNGHKEDSNAKTILDKWFIENLLDEFNAPDSKIDRNAGFCGDRSAYDFETHKHDNSLGTGTQLTRYGAYIRNYPKSQSISVSNPAQPSYICPDLANDLFTYIGSNKGTRSLTYPIGLISADEVTYAGGLHSIESSSIETYYNTRYFLFNNSNYWTISPSLYNGSHPLMSRVYFNGILADGNAGDGERGLRPVLNLVSGSLTLGDGSSNNPFTTS